ncbi:flagellar hook protein FlgE [Maridesulfovibrio ferrireducens]|uniref:Flagellar hook protein FlgE n=1 Tax=Maridesulfovibrio ferrireducens TaxID=246191 RepID=A0A1G9J731_9BACT|nr:flagellar hook protein FlgE [Maridesulfovibrio ferrireducens]SDL33102.1 flagellar hook protein FlgE [Maridesulfovibrio ferrireducens]
MGLSASLYSGITGLQAHGDKMSVLGNNIANVNTVGFKSAKMHFEDAISQDMSTATGIAQVGRGVQVGAIYADFAQGSFETTSESTDLAIGGSGFFIVKPKEDESTYYSRAGNFRFDKDGYLTDPHGYVLQGWQVQKSSGGIATGDTTTASNAVRTVGVPTDIRLENFQSAPLATSRVNMITNLDSGDASHATSATNPYFSLFEAWDGTADPPLGDSLYGYQSTIKVYDANGSSHNVTTYFDQVTLSNAGGKKVWEFIVTSQPNEDGRLISGTSSFATSSAAGLLMTGTMTFNAAGDLTGVSAFTLKSGVSGAGIKTLSNWTLANFSQNGLPVLTANFLSTSNASFTDSVSPTTIEMNFGLSNQDLSGSGITKGWNTGSATISNAGQLGTDITDVSRIPNFGEVEKSALSTTSYSTGSTTLFQSQDGYTAGFLQNVSVSRDGVLTGRYSNGQILELYVLTLADFNNRWGLRREGGNLFSETRESGDALTGLPNSGGKGSIASNSLEASNVDLAVEFVNMITTQRGFQANSKVITTTDTMMGELIQLKR